jgi:hypothetical protein
MIKKSRKEVAMQMKKQSGATGEVLEKFEKVREIMGADALLDNLMQAMSSSEVDELLDYIIRMHSIELD